MVLESALRSVDELPEPTAEQVLFRNHVLAMMRIIGRKKGLRYLKLMSEQLALEAGLSNVTSIRPHRMARKVQISREQAAMLWHGLQPMLVAALPPADMD